MIWSGCCQNLVPGQKGGGRSIVWTFPWNRHRTAILLLRLLSQHAVSSQDNILKLLSQHAVSSQDNSLKFAFGAQGSKPWSS